MFNFLFCFLVPVSKRETFLVAGFNQAIKKDKTLKIGLTDNITLKVFFHKIEYALVWLHFRTKEGNI